MDALDRESLVSLAGHRGWPSISIYLPTHQLPREWNEDRIRLKNLVRQALEELIAGGMREADAEQLLGNVRNGMIESDTFWREPSRGLAIFLTPEGQTMAHKLDTDMPEQCVVGDRFYVRPLVTAYHAEERFYALALDKNMTRLFRGDRHNIEEISLPEGTPITFQDAMKYDDVASPDLTHSSTAPGRIASRGRQHQGSVYGGHGGQKDAATEQTARFARLIEHGVAQVLENENAPLVLLGIDRQLSYYRLVNTYKHLAEEQILGASDFLSPKQVHEMARDALSEKLRAAVDEDLSELNELEGSALSSHDPIEIATAAAAGRVKTLFFDDSVGPFGTFDHDSNTVEQICGTMPRFLREQQQAAETIGAECGWDLVDLAAAETALHGGEVHAFAGEGAPVSGVAAVFRY